MHIYLNNFLIHVINDLNTLMYGSFAYLTLIKYIFMMFLIKKKQNFKIVRDDNGNGIFNVLCKHSEFFNKNSYSFNCLYTV